MRITSNLKFCLGFLIILPVCLTGIFLLILNYDAVLTVLLSPFLSKEARATIAGFLPYTPFLLAALLLLPFIIKIIRNSLWMRADAIYKVFADKSRLGIHIFASHFEPNHSEYILPGLFTVLHYFIRERDGKVFHTSVMSYTDKIASGHSGYQGFDSFEKTVLKSKHLSKSLQKLSKKSGIALVLDKSSKPSGYTIRFQKKPFVPDSPLADNYKKLLIFHSLRPHSYSLTFVENGKVVWEYKGKNYLTARNQNCFILQNQLIIINKFETSWDEGFRVMGIDLLKGRLQWKTKI